MAIIPKGLFITLEGGDGCGKTTQAKLLAERLTLDGHDVVLLSNHAATPAAAQIRQLYLSGTDEIWSPVVEAFLLYGARVDMWERIVKPALDTGKIVVADRFADSTSIYQGVVGGVAQARLDHLNQACLGGKEPDLTLVLDAPVELGASRVGDKPDRFEARPLAWYQKIRDGYLAIATANPRRCLVIDASRSLNEVATAIHSAVTQRLGL